MPKKTARKGGPTNRRRPTNTPMKDDLVDMLRRLGHTLTHAIVDSWDAETRKVVRMYAHHKLHPNARHSPVARHKPNVLTQGTKRK